MPLGQALETAFYVFGRIRPEPVLAQHGQAGRADPYLVVDDQHADVSVGLTVAVGEFHVGCQFVVVGSSASTFLAATTGLMGLELD